MSNKSNRAIVVKIGGATLGSHDTTIEDIVHLQKQDKSLIVVHGGGKLISEWLNKLGVSSQFVKGERVTDEVTLDMVTAVLAGLINKEIVGAINSLGGEAVGISGVDGALIQSRIKDAKLGYVGTVVKINLAPVAMLLKSGYIPVVAPVGLHSPDKPDEATLMLNINGDMSASEIAITLKADNLIFLTDVSGVQNSEGSLLPSLSPDEARALIDSGVIKGGMIPKVEGCLRALSSVSSTQIIDGRNEGALLAAIEGNGNGTTIE